MSDRIVDWADALGFPQWLAWDGDEILGPISVDNYAVMARLPAAGTTAPQYTKLNGVIATRRGDEILSFQTLETRVGQGIRVRLLVASSSGAPAGSLLACGAEHFDLLDTAPSGIAANDSAIYVSYRDGNDAVIARVSPCQYFPCPRPSDAWRSRCSSATSAVFSSGESAPGAASGTSTASSARDRSAASSTLTAVLPSARSAAPSAPSGAAWTSSPFHLGG